MTDGAAPAPRRPGRPRLRSIPEEDLHHPTAAWRIDADKGLAARSEHPEWRGPQIAEWVYGATSDRYLQESRRKKIKRDMDRRETELLLHESEKILKRVREWLPQVNGLESGRE